MIVSLVFHEFFPLGLIYSCTFINIWSQIAEHIRNQKALYLLVESWEMLRSNCHSWRAHIEDTSLRELWMLTAGNLHSAKRCGIHGHCGTPWRSSAEIWNLWGHVMTLWHQNLQMPKWNRTLNQLCPTCRPWYFYACSWMFKSQGWAMPIRWRVHVHRHLLWIGLFFTFHQFPVIFSRLATFLSTVGSHPEDLLLWCFVYHPSLIKITAEASAKEASDGGSTSHYPDWQASQYHTSHNWATVFTTSQDPKNI